MPKLTLHLTIPAGESLSSSGDLSARSVLLILAPIDWTPANVSFMISDDNISFYNLTDHDGEEVTRAIKPGCAIMVDSAVTQAATYVAVRSGSAESPIEQEADRTLTLICI
jgi:hypothetical protein